MSIGRWLADNLIPWALAGVAFSGSYAHLVALAETHGVRGAVAYESAACVDAIVAMAARERQRDQRIRRRHRGFASWPVIVLSGGVVLTLAGNLAMAQHSPWGWTMAGVPPMSLLVAISMIERRSGHNSAATSVGDGSDVSPATTTTVVARPPERDDVAATNGHDPAVAATSRGAMQAAMRAHWDAETAKGRIPTGAALNRAAGKDPNYSLGKRYAAAWRAEIEGERPGGGEEGTSPPVSVSRRSAPP